MPLAIKSRQPSILPPSSPPPPHSDRMEQKVKQLRLLKEGKKWSDATAAVMFKKCNVPRAFLVSFINVDVLDQIYGPSVEVGTACATITPSLPLIRPLIAACPCFVMCRSMRGRRRPRPYLHRHPGARRMHHLLLLLNRLIQILSPFLLLTRS